MEQGIRMRSFIIAVNAVMPFLIYIVFGYEDRAGSYRHKGAGSVL